MPDNDNPRSRGDSPDNIFGPRSKEFSKEFIYRRALLGCFDKCSQALPLDLEAGDSFAGRNQHGQRVHFLIDRYERLGRLAEFRIGVVYLEDIDDEANSRSRMFEVRFEKGDGASDFSLVIDNYDFIVENEDIVETRDEADIDDLIFLNKGLSGLELERHE